MIGRGIVMDKAGERKEVGVGSGDFRVVLL